MMVCVQCEEEGEGTLLKETEREMEPESVIGDNGTCRKCGALQPAGKGVMGKWHDEKCEWFIPGM